MNFDELKGKLDSSLQPVKSGKVGELYMLPDSGDLLIAASDRISIFDFVLGSTVPFKGEVLNALTIFWIDVLSLIMRHNIWESGNGIDECLPQELQSIVELQKRSIVVLDDDPHPVEIIVRGHLTGSAWKSYQETGKVFGYDVGTLLHDGSRLPEPIITPTTKAESGHDLPMTYEEALRIVGKEKIELCLDIYKRAYKIAWEKGIIIADTKFETGENYIIDEVLTPDSSRFWDKEEWQLAAQAGKSPQGYDKQPVRE